MKFWASYHWVFLICGILLRPAYSALKEQRLFTMEKSYNQENIMVIYAQTDEKCSFIPFENGSYLNYYWLMDGKKRKDVHPLIKKGIEKRVEFKSVEDKHKEFTAELNDLDEVKHDLPDTAIKVEAQNQNGNCNALATISLGPSGGNQAIELENTYCKVEKNWVGVPKGCLRLELEGEGLTSKQDVLVKFDKR